MLLVDGNSGANRCDFLGLDGDLKSDFVSS